nr:GtrA family protein [Desulfobulbaceae bacterium]
MTRLQTQRELISFMIIGGGCYGLSILLLYFFTDICNLHYLISTLLAFVAANFAGYSCNRHYTFTGANNSYWHGLWRYNAVLLTSLLLVISFMYLLVDILHVWYLLANILITTVITVYNFFIHKRWTFK